jgi:branched-chain amino acid aminotransferase
MELVRIDADWVPASDAASLYIRPALMATDPTLELSNPKSAKLFVITGPVGAYFPSGLKPITVLADPQVARAFPGGVGGFKMARCELIEWQYNKKNLFNLRTFSEA